MKRVLVCGGRDYDDRERVFSELDRLRPDVVIQGGCPTGADAHARSWAVARAVNVRDYKPMWKVFGLAAGPIRNQFMLNDAKPDLVIAFPGGKGTADMIRRAEKAGVEVVRVA